MIACSSATSTGEGGAPPQSCTGLTAPSSCPTPPPSWKSQVQPFIQSYCTQCHGPGGIAAAQALLATYQDVKNNRTRAWQQVYSCLMPNAGATPAPNAFPTETERQMFVDWADVCNAPNN